MSVYSPSLLPPVAARITLDLLCLYTAIVSYTPPYVLVLCSLNFLLVDGVCCLRASPHRYRPIPLENCAISPTVYLNFVIESIADAGGANIASTCEAVDCI